MRYTLFLHYAEPAPGELDDATMEAGRTAMRDYAQALVRAGVLVSAEVFQPSARATTVRVADGAPRVHDGPFTGSREQIGGTFVLDVPDRESAVDWATKCPAARWGAVELRPAAARVVDGHWVEA